jgi:transketolase
MQHVTERTNLGKPRGIYDDSDRLAATTIRILAADAVQQANSGHPGLPLGAADMALVLWTRYLKHNPADPFWPDRDRFVLSAGHGSALLYSLLHLDGYDMPLEEVKRFRQYGSATPGHPEYDPKRGVETTTGPLGQGLGNSVGMALAERLLATRFNREGFSIVDHFTYVLASDGDLMEGVSHEAASFAGHYGLGRLIVLYDDNHVSIDGSTDLAYSDNALERFAGYGWHVQRADGHDMLAVDAALQAAREETERPSIIACRTHIGYGSPRQDNAKVHGAPLGEEDLRKTKEFYGWDPEARFYIPDEVRAYFAQDREAGAARQAAWEELLAAYREAYPDLAEQWELYVNGELPEGWQEDLPVFSAEKPMATRVASGKVLDAVAPSLFTLVGGSADLTPSNNTLPKGGQVVSRGEYGGMYLHFGVREHAMGAIMSGLALHGLRPYGGTFLIFSDYMRPTLRLAAMMGLPVIYVYTHDSIGLGEDGPTHQPVEHLTALRAIPNLMLIRPADANETAAAWKVALERVTGPTALALTRQDLPVITPPGDNLAKGAYVLAEADGGAPQVVLLATGSEVSLALGARQLLAEQGIRARVVSMPCWELFDEQPQDYRESVLPAGVPRLSVEAGVTLAWGRYLGGVPHVALGLDHYGASAPYKTIFQEFGLTPEKVAEAARRLVDLR